LSYIEGLEKAVNEEVNRIIVSDMSGLCFAAENMEPETVKLQATIIARSSEYAKQIVLQVFESLKNKGK
jgi:hypothetical protein